MQSVSNVEQSSAAQVFTEFLSLINQNAQTWEDLFAEDVSLSPSMLPIYYDK